MPLQEDYRVTLDAFQGPLDLLLFLIRRAEVDIHDIPVAEITDQYLAFLQQIEDIDVELAGEFLVMAATLIELKSRTLAPPEDGETGATEDAESQLPGAGADPRYELVRQLLAYQRYRIAAEELDARRIEFAHRFPLRAGQRDRRPPEAAPGTAGAEDEPADEELPEAVELELEDVHIMDLAEAYERITASIDFSRFGDHVVEVDDTPIALHQEDLLDRLARAEAQRLTLQETFEGQTRGQRIGLFLAALELVRLHRVTVLQDDIDSEIELALIGEGEEKDEGIERGDGETQRLRDEETP
ncbi:MAG: segregation/condensation protein A [Planctomycetota bacterium]|nr:segregation/condensation protein A [Planctomycetota bacterium]